MLNHMKTPLNGRIVIVGWSFLFLWMAGCTQPQNSGTTPRPANELTPGEIARRRGKPPVEQPAKSEPSQGEPAKPDPEALTTRVEVEEEKEVPPEAAPPIPEGAKALNRENTLFFEKLPDGTRRVHLLAEVCMREGPLEVLLCKANTKEHEAILHADIDGRQIHTALVAAGAKFGSTVKYQPEYKPAKGDVIKVSLTYNLNGKLRTSAAQSWIHHRRTKKQMEHDWVFAGSRFFEDPDKPDAPPFYCANNGELISIANFPDSMLDLPVKSSKEEAELGFGATTDRIPPLKTKVLITFEPAGPPKN